jgi:hypothetical protein
MTDEAEPEERLQLGCQHRSRHWEQIPRNFVTRDQPETFDLPSRAEIDDPAARLSQCSEDVEASGLQLFDDPLDDHRDEIA